jgi:regulator of protease activity HflC (stomatin/prohibitin superfamily)
MSGERESRQVMAKQKYDGRPPVATWIALAGGAAVALFVLVVGIMVIRGWRAVPPDKIMLHYTGGPIQGTHFKEMVNPGTATRFYGLMDNYFYLPSTQRTYIISKDPNAGDIKGVDFVSAPSNDNVPFTFEVAVYFKLNPKAQVIRQFFEQICLHDHCTDLSPNGGWDKMLAQYFRPQVENALRIEAGRYDREHLYRDPNTLQEIQRAIGPVLSERINTALGGQFFCGPDSSPNNCTTFGFVLKNPSPPENVVQAYADTAASAQKVVTAENDAKAKAAAAKGDADAQAARAAAPALSDAQISYIRAQAEQACASNPQCTLIVNGGGAGVNVNAGK